MVKVKFKRLFGKTILERGHNYYKEGRVSNLLKNSNAFTASVHGSNRYKVSIDLDSDILRCNCPYDMGNCKHLAAVFYEISNQKNIKSIASSTPALSKKSKEELIAMINQMVAQEPKLNAVLLSKNEQLIDKIKNIDNEDEETYKEFYDYVPDRIEEIMADINIELRN